MLCSSSSYRHPVLQRSCISHLRRSLKTSRFKLQPASLQLLHFNDQLRGFRLYISRSTQTSALISEISQSVQEFQHKSWIICCYFSAWRLEDVLVSDRFFWEHFSFWRLLFIELTSPSPPSKQHALLSSRSLYIFIPFISSQRFYTSEALWRAFITRQQISLAFYSSGAVHRPQVFFLHLSIYLQTLGLIIKIKLTGFSFSSSQPVHRPQLLKLRKSKARQRRRWIHSDSFTARGE